MENLSKAPSKLTGRLACMSNANSLLSLHHPMGLRQYSPRLHLLMVQWRNESNASEQESHRLQRILRPLLEHSGSSWQISNVTPRRPSRGEPDPSP
jgi:hypothetical protein